MNDKLTELAKEYAETVPEPTIDERLAAYLDSVQKGGPGSGNFGHQGIPGQVGGSTSGGGGGGGSEGGGRSVPAPSWNKEKPTAQDVAALQNDELVAQGAARLAGVPGSEIRNVQFEYKSPVEPGRETLTDLCNERVFRTGRLWELAEHKGGITRSNVLSHYRATQEQIREASDKGDNETSDRLSNRVGALDLYLPKIGLDITQYREW